MEYGVDFFNETDIIDQLAETSNKFVMHLKAVGPSEIDDAEKIEDVWDFYFGKMDTKILNALRQYGELYCYFSTQEQAINAMEEWLPAKRQLLDDEMHYYIYCYVVSPDKTIRLVNL